MQTLLLSHQVVCRTNTALPSAHQTTAEGMSALCRLASRIERTTTGLGTCCHPCHTLPQVAGSHELRGKTSPDDDDDDDDGFGSGRGTEKKCGAMLFCAGIRSFYVCTCIVKHVPLSLAMKPDRAGLHAAGNNASNCYLQRLRVCH